MSKVANMINMVLYLTHHNRVKIKKLSKFLEVKPRMVRLYKTELEQAGIYIDSKKGKYGGYSLNQQKMIKNLGLNFDEINSLNMAEKFLMKDKSFPYLKEFSQGIQKINYEVSKDISRSEKVEIKSKGKQNAYKKREDIYLEKIYLAIIKKKKLEIEYYSLSSDETKKRIIHPYVVIFYSGFAYLIAYCEKRNKFLNFKVIRIEKFKSLNTTFKKDESFDLKEIITPGYGFVHDKWIKIKLKIDFPKSFRVKEKIIVENQKIKVLEDKSIIFTAKMISKKEIISWILSLGSSVTILKPLSLQKEIKDELNNMIKNI